MTLTKSGYWAKEEYGFKSDRTKSGRDRYGFNGRPMTGVTTILNEHNKAFLVGWAASEAYKDARGKSKAEIDEIIKNKTYAHTRKSDSAKDNGSKAHSYVEDFVQTYIDTGKYVRATITDDEVAHSVGRFYDWAESNKVKFIATEETVYDTTLFYAGSFDFICDIGGKVYLGDFKTSKQISDEYYAQCAAYIKAHQRLQARGFRSKVEFVGSIIVKSTLAKEDAVRFEKSTAGFKKIVTPAFEIGKSVEIEKDYGFFLSCLYQYRYSKDHDVKFWNSTPIEKYCAETLTDYSEEDMPLQADRE